MDDLCIHGRYDSAKPTDLTDKPVMHIIDYNGIMVNHKQLEHMLRYSRGYDRDRYRYDQKRMGSAAGAGEDWSF